jgi:Holliday junction resolvase RusA-like endonuclease
MASTGGRSVTARTPNARARARLSSRETPETTTGQGGEAAGLSGDSGDSLEVRFVIPGKPVSWKRGNIVKGRIVTDKAMRAAKTKVRFCAVSAMARQSPLEGPLELRCDFYNRRKRTAVPDVDNLLKLIADALNGVVYIDDAQCVLKVGAKHDTREVGGTPRTVVTITRAPAAVRNIPKARAS